MSSSNCCFLTCIQISQEAGQVVWCSHFFKNFPQFVVISTPSQSPLLRVCNAPAYKGSSVPHLPPTKDPCYLLARLKKSHLWVCFLGPLLVSAVLTWVFPQMCKPERRACINIILGSDPKVLRRVQKARREVNSRGHYWVVGGRFKREGTYVHLWLIHVWCLTENNKNL